MRSSSDGTDGGPTLWTADQRLVDRAARSLVVDPQVVVAKVSVLNEWSSLPPATSKDGKATLAGAVDELTFLVALTIAQRVLHPDTIISIETPPGTWVPGAPGSRWATDNPDRIYRLATVDRDFQYVIEGRRSSMPSNDDFSFDATVDGVTTLVTLCANEIDVSADGRFEIRLDASPTDGRRNHLSLPPGTNTIVIRDTLAQWHEQIPNRLTIRRLGSGPTTPGSRAQAVEQTISLLEKYAELDAGWIDSFQRPPINRLVPRMRASENGLGGTVAATSRFSLQDDEALVVTIDPQGAGYVGFMLADPWGVSIPYWNDVTSLSDRQAHRGGDGSITLAIACRDPGYVNWLSTNCLNDGLMSLRLENMTAPGSVDPTRVVRSSSVVHLDALGSALPPETRRVTADERARGRAAREAGFNRRRTD